MIDRLRDPILLFRFALRERDWPLAGLLAGPLGSDVTLRPRLEREVHSLPGADPLAPRSLGALRTLGALLRVVARERGRG